VCRQRFRILKIIQVEPYLIADVAYGFSGMYMCHLFSHVAFMYSEHYGPIVSTAHCIFFIFSFFFFLWQHLDVDVLEAELNGGELSDNVLNMEREIYQILCDVISLTNKLFEEENSDGINRGDAVLGLSSAVKLLSPQKHLFRLSVASDFSFAVSDMIGASSRLKQLLLQSNRLDSRLLKIKTALINARSFLIDRIDAYDEPFN
jgi:hypothetical protein